MLGGGGTDFIVAVGRAARGKLSGKIERNRIMSTRIAAVVVLWLICFAHAAEVAPVELRWLDRDAPAVAQGVSWGVPWPRGAVQKDAHFRAGDVPIQSWV